MSTNMSTNQPTGSQPYEVTMDRIDAVMASRDITLVRDDTRRIAQANINGFTVIFALLGSVLVVRADAATDISADATNATFYLAANQVNSTTFGARAVIVNKTEKLVVRTERELPISAGLNDAQLSHTLQTAIDGILSAQDTMVAVTEQLNQLMEDNT
ncbi:YbjN domain-containing protein [Corynebacterium cystitidis]|uniref:Putative sensory transduction regulator n=1 Tax=Corynebacterium cystitidis DSM 20524 TaxID=1121357 RepID=A0A1H9PGK9_9CORY|nr:YbjN domain-containing protein [Corynebacterium cystitidis]WJY82511.1 hypothetical protein CCYS_07940 [Corynebacterium cystitidis DSM 20524]SER46999.1 Putative sensory transduction regulator [Corynebacterium cystitidis DSM 20524]SNV74960.1 Uncharacterised protein [Corynebacterium cystitidis]